MPFIPVIIIIITLCIRLCMLNAHAQCIFLCHQFSSVYEPTVGVDYGFKIETIHHIDRKLAAHIHACRKVHK